MIKPDILLFRANNKKLTYPGLEEKNLTACEPPLWGAILAGYLRDRGHKVELWDAEVEGWSYKETIENINHLHPRLALMIVSGSNPSASSMQMVGIDKVFPWLRVDIATAVHGLHPSALPPEETLERHPSVYFVVKGEGFDQVDDFLSGRTMKSSYPLKDLATLPLPAWDLLPINKYRAMPFMAFNDLEKRSPYYVLHTSFGCPFKCSFCCINVLFGKRGIRYRPIEKVIAELDWVKEMYPNLKHIKISDEMFALSEKRIVALCNAIADRNYGFDFEVYARVDTVTEKMLEAMAKAGVEWVAYGFESGSEAVLEKASKGQTLEAIYKAANLTWSYGMNIVGNYIFGLEGATHDSHRKTLNLMLELNTLWANVNVAIAYPGSDLYSAKVKEGWKPPTAYTAYAQHTPDSAPIGGEWAVEERDRAWNTYFTSLKYLSCLNFTFGLKAVAFVKDMTSHKLRRNHATT